MRKRLICAACSAFCISSAASSATFVTSTNLSGPTPSMPAFPSALKAFESSLGTLTGITLQVSGDHQAGYNAFVSNPALGPGTAQFDYDGLFVVVLNGRNYSFEVSGSDALSLSSERPSKFGVFTATGSGIFNLDPSLFDTFTDTPGACPFFADPVCVSLATHGIGIQDLVTSSNNINITAMDVYTPVSVKLTYTYTPFGDAVPEPTTWAMMILGFGGIGFALRPARKRCEVPNAITRQEQTRPC